MYLCTHIVAKAPVHRRGTMLKPGFVAGLHSFVVHDYHFSCKVWQKMYDFGVKKMYKKETRLNNNVLMVAKTKKTEKEKRPKAV